MNSVCLFWQLRLASYESPMWQHKLPSKRKAIYAPVNSGDSRQRHGGRSGRHACYSRLDPRGCFQEPEDDPPLMITLRIVCPVVTVRAGGDKLDIFLNRRRRGLCPWEAIKGWVKTRNARYHAHAAKNSVAKPRPSASHGATT